MIKFIADIGSNHRQNLSRAIALIDTAKSIGCDAVKFQLFTATKLYALEFPQRKEALKNELPTRWIPLIAEKCKAVGIEFHCTPFDIGGVELLAPYVNEFKIASYSVLDLELIRRCAETHKPLTIAAGACTDDELKDAFRQARMLNHRVRVAHCVATYPTPPELCDLQRIADLKYRFGEVGWSDHTANAGIVHYAVALGAQFIEFHLDADGSGNEYEHGHCWLPYDAAAMIASVRGSVDALRLANDVSVAIDLRWRNDPDDEARPQKKYREEILKEAK